MGLRMAGGDDREGGCVDARPGGLRRKLLSQARLGGDAQALLLWPFTEIGHEGRGAHLPGREPLSRSRATDVGLDLVELGDPARPLDGNLGAIAVEHFLQLAPRVNPAMRHADRIRTSPCNGSGFTTTTALNRAGFAGGSNS